MIHINDNVGWLCKSFLRQRLKGKISFPTVMEMNSSQMSQPLLVFWTYAKWKPDLLPATQWTTMKTTSLWYLYDLLKLTGKQCQQFRLLSLLHYFLNWVKLDNHLRIKYRWDPIMIIVWHLLNLDCQGKAKIWINFCPSPKSQIKPVVCVVNSLEFWGKKYFLLAVKKITHSLILTQSFASNEMNL